VTGEDGDVDFGDYSVLVADDAVEQVFTLFERGQEVVAEFVLDGFRLPVARAEFLERGGLVRGDGQRRILVAGIRGQSILGGAAGYNEGDAIPKPETDP
jgi:hypothetical protein